MSQPQSNQQDESQFHPDTPRYFLTHADDDLRRMLGIVGFQRVGDLWDADFIIFPDGPPIYPFLYGESPLTKKYKYDIDRDREEIQATRFTTKDQVLIGIGRGAHLLNTCVGIGTCHQEADGHDVPYHIAKDETGRDVTVSSKHSQIMIPGLGAQVLLRSHISTKYMYEDGKVRDVTPKDSQYEALLYVDRKTLCYQPNPGLNDIRNVKNREFFFDTVNCYFLTKKQEEAMKENVRRRREKNRKGN